MTRPQETDRPLQSRVFPADTLGLLESAGFEAAVIGRDPERIRILKGNCALLLARTAEGELFLYQKPGYLIKGEIARLWDAGYQKFWLLGKPADDPFTEDRRPALASHLRELKAFENDVRTALEIPSFYNESIGSTNKITAYDRVYGRDASSAQRR